MPSRADILAVDAVAPVASAAAVLRVVGAVLHALAFLSMSLLLWRLLAPQSASREMARIDAEGRLNLSLAQALYARSDTLDVQLASAPGALSRASLRALRGSGRMVHLASDAPFAPVAVSVEEEWRLSGGARVQLLGADSMRATISDAAGVIDTATLNSRGARTRAGPVQGVLRVRTRDAHASVSALSAAAPTAGRVLVLGSATWETRFLIAALEEAGWSVDAALSLSPKVTVGQGGSRTPLRNRHSIVVVLPGALPSALAALPSFVRTGGGLVIVGAAARMPALASLRAGVPGATIDGVLGAEAGSEPHHGLDLVPMSSLNAGSVVLESRDAKAAVAAHRVGAGRVVQVGYENSWLWRMAGNDDAPVGHRQWWTGILSGVMPLTVPVRVQPRDPAHDTLDAAPIAALVRDLGMPVVQGASVQSVSRSFVSRLSVTWLLALATLSFVVSWTMRRWRGLA
jgi:hypothetical protein